MSLLTASSILLGADLYLCGDSIMADYRARDPRPCYGWGEFMQAHCRENVRVFDLAVPGSSTASWRKSNLWQNALKRVQKGDFVFLGFGLNDSDAENPAAFCTDKEFEQNLLEMAENVRSKGATPLFLTSTVTYQEPPEKRARHALYNDATRRAAAAGKVELVDLNAKFLPFIDAAPDAGRYFVLKRGFPVKNWLDYDPVHLSEAGAQCVAKMVVDLIAENHLSAQKLFQ